MRPIPPLPADLPDGGWFHIFKKICALAVPISFQWLIGMGQWLVPFFFLGHVSSAALGGYALGNMFCNFTGNAIAIGFLSNMSSLNSQAFGAKNAELYALYAQEDWHGTTPDQPQWTMLTLRNVGYLRIQALEPFSTALMYGHCRLNLEKLIAQGNTLEERKQQKQGQQRQGQQQEKQ